MSVERRSSLRRLILNKQLQKSYLSIIKIKDKKNIQIFPRSLGRNVKNLDNFQEDPKLEFSISDSESKHTKPIKKDMTTDLT